MASPNSSIKIHDQCLVTPPPSASPTSLPLTFFDLIWLRFHPVERIFFYSLPLPLADSVSFSDKVVPKLKSSLSLTLQHFLPLAGKLLWPSGSPKPIVQYSPGDGVSFIVAESDAEFNHVLDNSPHEAPESRSLVPHLDSSDSFASIVSLQITLFPNRGFCIGISTHHAVLDGKSSTMFLKAWASLCSSNEDSPSLAPQLEPFFEREVIKDPKNLDVMFLNLWVQVSAKLDPNDNGKGRSLKTLMSRPLEEHSVRATYELTRENLEKIKKRVLWMWNLVEEAEPPEDKVDCFKPVVCSKPSTLSSFVLTSAYVTHCIAKAIQETETVIKKFVFGFHVDCRTRLEPPIPENYFGNCVVSHVVDMEPEDLTKEDGVVIVAKKIYGKIKTVEKDGAVDGLESLHSRYMSMMGEGVKGIGVAGSNKFGVYGVDFGWGKPEKVELTSIDRNLTIGFAESKSGTGGVEVGLVLSKKVMDLFHGFFMKGYALTKE